MIALIDYGAGNLTSVRKAFAAIGADLSMPPRRPISNERPAIVVPGVGHFGATAALGRDWTSAIRARVERGPAAARHLPRHAVAVRRQRRGARLPGPRRAGRARATGLPASTRLGQRAQGAARRLEQPRHCSARRRSSPASTQGSQVYFTHSFIAPVTDDTVAVTEHGEPFAAIVERGRVAGVQFHPEKSGDVGLRDPAQLRRDGAACCLSASSPASTSATARSSRA